MAGDNRKELEDLYGGGETSEVQTMRIFKENAPFAAAQIIDLCTNAASDSIKLRAATYVVDRVLGPVGKEEQKDKLTEFLEGIEALANGREK
jgi:hypothetical protein